jgi:3-phosphoshikimate 1-carboxyvinyltransferase
MGGLGKFPGMTMPLPDLIEIVPLTKPVKAEITVPGSKSITNRALILAALADGEVTLKGALWSEDTQVMTDCLQKLGFSISVKPDPDEFCNRTITVQGLGGKIPNAGTDDKPLELFVGNAGTAARFLSAFVCLGEGVYRLSGVPRMHERPQAALFKALRELGYQVESPNDKLPAVITGNSGSRMSKPERSCTVSIEKSSQFASALLLCAQAGNWRVKVVGENAEESPYVAMTVKMIEEFAGPSRFFQIEPDASSASYFLAANEISPTSEFKEYSKGLGIEVATTMGSSISVMNTPDSELQVDANFFDVLDLGSHPTLFRIELNKLDPKGQRDFVEGMVPQHANVKPISRKDDLADSIMTAIILSAIMPLPVSSNGSGMTRFTDLARLRLQETERVVALRTELTKCGTKVIEEGDTLTVYPSELHGAEIETYNDHRMAMCFAILGLKVPGIKLKNPACVKKTFPNFFQKLAAAPPAGLGAEIWEIKNGARTRKLFADDLFAE